MQVVIQSSGPSFIVRALWYVFIGWWLAGLAITAGYLAAITIVGLPLAFYIFNRIPTVLTLRSRTTRYVAATTAANTTIIREQTLAQRPMWIRGVYFVLVGWWLGAIWLGIAYLFSILIVTLPLGLLMFNRTGGFMTLLRY